MCGIMSRADDDFVCGFINNIILYFASAHTHQNPFRIKKGLRCPAAESVFTL